MSELQSTISKEALNELPVGMFDGKIIVFDSVREIQKIIPFLNKQKVLGFDTETRPSFTKGKVNKVALLQLATAEEAFLFRINKTGLPQELAAVLADPNITKIGAAIRDDIKSLQKLTPFEAGGFIDLQIFVKQFGIEDNGLQKLSGNILGIRISKNQRLTNWENPELSESQQTYAATDAWVSLKIYDKLKAMFST